MIEQTQSLSASAAVDYSDPLRVNASEPIGGAKLQPATDAPRIAPIPEENFVKMTGEVIPLSQYSMIFKRCEIYGVSANNAPGTPPTPNDPNAVVMLGRSKTFLGIQVQPYAGQWSYVLEAPEGRVYDLARIFACGPNTCGISYSLEIP